MSTLGVAVSKMNREYKLLKDLNSSLMALEAECLGKIGEFGFTQQDIKRSREVITDFIEHVLSELNKESGVVDLQSLVAKMKSDVKPISDWEEDMQRVLAQLTKGYGVSKDDLYVLEDMISMLDDDFAKDIKSMYFRY